MLKAKRFVIASLVKADAVSRKVYVGNTRVIVQKLGQNEQVLRKKVALWKVQQNKIVLLHLVERHTPSIDRQFFDPFVEHKFGHVLQTKCIQMVIFEIYVLIQAWE
jgi:hypothetical protein